MAHIFSFCTHFSFCPPFGGAGGVSDNGGGGGFILLKMQLLFCLAFFCTKILLYIGRLIFCNKKHSPDVQYIIILCLIMGQPER